MNYEKMRTELMRLFSGQVVDSSGVGIIGSIYDSGGGIFSGARLITGASTQNGASQRW